MNADIQLVSFDAERREAKYKGDTLLEAGPRSKNLSFDLTLQLPPEGAIEPMYRLSLKLDTLTHISFETGRKRLALWLRNIAEALEGAVEEDIVLGLRRTTKTAVYEPALHTVPDKGDPVVWNGEVYRIERHAARDQVSIHNDVERFFVPAGKLRWAREGGQFAWVGTDKIPTEGDPVLYSGETYKVVSCSEGQVRIDNGGEGVGDWHNVPIARLQWTLTEENGLVWVGSIEPVRF